MNDLFGLGFCRGMTLGCVLSGLINRTSAIEPIAISANELACQIEKQVVSGASPELFENEWPVTLAAHEHVCDGNRCYVVEGESTVAESNIGEEKIATANDDSEAAIHESSSAPPMVTSPTRSIRGILNVQHGLHKVPANAAQSTSDEPSSDKTSNSHQELVEVHRVNAELLTRLEFSETLLGLQHNHSEQMSMLLHENSRLAAEVAELRARQELGTQLTNSLLECAELSSKLAAAQDWITNRTAYEASLPVSRRSSSSGDMCREETIAAIQEDLSNLRRQLPLIKRTPVPYAISNLPVDMPNDISAKSETGDFLSELIRDSDRRLTENAASTVEERTASVNAESSTRKR